MPPVASRCWPGCPQGPAISPCCLRCWRGGVGLGLLTPAVVAASVAAVESGRAGLAAGVNNSSRQAGGVLGIAVYGALAGSPAVLGGFLTGFHEAALLTTGLFAAAAVATVAGIQARGAPR